MNGVELFNYLSKVKTLDIPAAKFYSAQVFTVLSFLHSKSIIYRDLKPENLYINPKGYLVLTDFVLAKYCLSRTYTMCGTPEYLAPEIILNKGYNHSVDWWGLGIFVYELLVGKTPFADEEPTRVYKKVLEGSAKFPAGFDKYFTHNAKGSQKSGEAFAEAGAKRKTGLHEEWSAGYSDA